MRLIVVLAAHLTLITPNSAVAQLAPAWAEGQKMVQLTTEIATTQLIVEMCKLDVKQLIDDGNTVLVFIKELHPISYKKG